jgi:hypothetical protein
VSYLAEGARAVGLAAIATYHSTTRTENPIPSLSSELWAVNRSVDEEQMSEDDIHNRIQSFLAQDLFQRIEIYSDGNIFGKSVLSFKSDLRSMMI